MKRHASFFAVVLGATLVLFLFSAACSRTEKPKPQPLEPQVRRVAVYYLKMTERDTYLVREVHEVEATEKEAVRAALEELIHGTPRTPGAFRVLPPDTRVRSVSIADGLATVDFSHEVLGANVGVHGEALGIQSIVNTLTEFPQVKRVRFMVEGAVDERAREWWGHVGLYEQPFERNLHNVWEPAIWVTSPAPGARVKSPLEVRGSARVFEGTVNLRLVDQDGKRLAETFTTATDGAPGRGDFVTSLTFTPPRGEKGYLEVFWQSPEDGSEQGKVRVPVRF